MFEKQPLQPIKRDPLLYERIRQSIVDYILQNKLKPGEKLPPESELARQLHVSRSSVRESIKSLEVVGVLRTERGNGVFIQEFSFDPLLEILPYSFLFDLRQLSDLWKIRQILEIALIDDAIALMTEDRLNELKEIVKAMQIQSALGNPFPEEDRKFHQVLFEHLNNQVLLKLLDTFWLAFRKATELAQHITWDSDPVRTYEKHQRIVDAIEARDADAAREALKYHYDDLTMRIERAQKKLAEQQSK